jgi:hypothetical protein
MAGSRKPSPHGADGVIPVVEDGTMVRGASPVPGSEGLSGVLLHKGSTGKHGGHLDRAIIRKARTEAIAMLTLRLNQLDAWDNEARRRGIGAEEGDALPAQCGPVRELFLGWFGKGDAAARSTIRNRIVKAIQKLSELSDSDFLTDRSDPDFAYVYPKSHERGKYERTVHLGMAFWAADDKTRAGTLIHELSHFVTVGGTADVGSSAKQRAAVDFPGINLKKYSGTYAAYGGARAARLALRNPTLALNNADSFEFFIEGDRPSSISDEKGNLDTEGFGDFPGSNATRG